MQFVFSHPQQQKASRTEQQCQVASRRWTTGHFQFHKQEVISDWFTFTCNWLMFNSPPRSLGWVLFKQVLTVGLSPGLGHKPPAGGENGGASWLSHRKSLKAGDLKGDTDKSFPKHRDYKPHKSPLLLLGGYLPKDKGFPVTGVAPRKKLVVWAAASKSLFPPPSFHQLITKPLKGGPQNQRFWPLCCPVPTQ